MKVTLKHKGEIYSTMTLNELKSYEIKLENKEPILIIDKNELLKTIFLIENSIRNYRRLNDKFADDSLLLIDYLHMWEKLKSLILGVKRYG